MGVSIAENIKKDKATYENYFDKKVFMTGFQEALKIFLSQADSPQLGSKIIARIFKVGTCCITYVSFRLRCHLRLPNEPTFVLFFIFSYFLFKSLE